MKNCYLSVFKTLPPSTYKKTLLHCSTRYTFINWLTLHLTKLHSAYIPLLLTLLLIPLCFYTIKTIAEKYLTNSIEKLKTFYKVPTLVASCTLIPFVNGVPDLMVIVVSSSDSEGLHIALGSLFGGFVFASLLISGFVVFFSKKGVVRVPFRAFLKELVIYLLGVGIVVFFGVWKKLNVFFALGLIFCYLGYILVTLCFFSGEVEVDFDKLGEKEEREVMDDLEVLNFENKDNKNNFEDIEELSKIKKDKIEKDINENLKNRLNFGNSLKSQIWNKEENLFTRLLNIPLKSVFLLTIPFEKNPFFKTPLKYILIFLSLLTSFFIFKKKTQTNPILIISSILTIIFSILSYFQKIKNHHKTFFHFLTLFTSICWMNLITQILLEIIFYYSFLLEINETFLSMIIISSGNSMGDLFSVVALSEFGDSLLAFLAVFSSQSYNLYIGLALNMIVGNDYHFDIFEEKIGRDHTGVIIRFLIVFVVGVILMLGVVGGFNGWVFGKWYFYVCLGCYVFFVFSMVVSLNF